VEKELYAGFIRLHILYHAARGPVFGLGILNDLQKHGYEMSPGTLYPNLHRMEEKGYLDSDEELVEGKRRRIYRITASGREALAKTKSAIRILFGEFFEDE
jgi:PadR family transcriptional regulator